MTEYKKEAPRKPPLNKYGLRNPQSLEDYLAMVLYQLENIDNKFYKFVITHCIRMAWDLVPYEKKDSGYITIMCPVCQSYLKLPNFYCDKCDCEFTKEELKV